MKSVLISIRPEWCEKIASGEKTMEVRKTKPNLDTPFKCYIYCTLPPKTELFTHSNIREYLNELIRLQSGEIVYDYGMQLCCDPEKRPYTEDNFLCQKVIGEFICDFINPIAYTMDGLADVVDCRQSCLRPRDFIEYGNGKRLYGWHISDLKIYDKPKCIGDFKVRKTNTIWSFTKKLERPPQSWCYVEELSHE